MKTSEILIIILSIIALVLVLGLLYFIILEHTLKYRPKHLKTLQNLVLLSKFPFLRVEYCEFNHKKKAYELKSVITTTHLDNFSDGWRLALGKNFCYELNNIIKQNGLKKSLGSYPYIEEIKDKYGELRLSISSNCEEIETLEGKYELLSTCYCEHCGKPARYLTRGWLMYLCEDCCLMIESRRRTVASKDNHEAKLTVEDIQQFRLTEDDIPNAEVCLNERDTNGDLIYIKVDLEKRYGINFYKAWDIQPKEK